MVNRLSEIQDRMSCPVYIANRSTNAPFEQSVFTMGKKPALKTDEEEGIFSKITDFICDNKVTNSILTFLRIKSDIRYQNLDPTSKMELDMLLREENVDLSNPETLEKINSWLSEYDMTSRRKTFFKAQKSAAKHAIKHSYSIMAGKNNLSNEIKKIQNSFEEDQKLLRAVIKLTSKKMDANTKARFIAEASKNAQIAREAAYEILENLIAENPTKLENIKKIYELGQNSAISENEMLELMLEEIACDEKVKEKARKEISKIKDKIPNEFKKYFEHLKESNAWEKILSFTKKLQEIAKTEVVAAEKKYEEQKMLYEVKKEIHKKEQKKLSEISYKAKLIKRKADAAIEEAKNKYNLQSIPQAKKKNLLKHFDINMYNRNNAAQAKLKKAKEAEYDAASEMRIAEVFLEIDKRNKEFTEERCAILS